MGPSGCEVVAVFRLSGSFGQLPGGLLPSFALFISEELDNLHGILFNESRWIFGACLEPCANRNYGHEDWEAG